MDQCRTAGIKKNEVEDSVERELLAAPAIQTNSELSLSET